MEKGEFKDLNSPYSELKIADAIILGVLHIDPNILTDQQYFDYFASADLMLKLQQQTMENAIVKALSNKD